MNNWKNQYRKKLNNQSRIEKILHESLQKNNMGAKRNKPVKGASGKYYFLDLYIRKAMIGIEVDGKNHDVDKDSKRDWDILGLHPRWTILRFTNLEVLNHLPEILFIIYKTIIKKCPYMSWLKSPKGV